MPLDASAKLERKLSRRERDAARGRLAKMRAEAVVALLIRLTRQGLEQGLISTPLNREAIYRQLIRSMLVLQSWHWQPADDVAAELVRIAFDTMRTKRPTWDEGQPDYVIDRGTLVERTRCANCGKGLEEQQRKFCGRLCGDAHGTRARRWAEADRDVTARGMAGRV